MTIRTEADVENLNLTNIPFRLGVGELKGHGLGSRGPRDRRTVTRWSFANAQEGRRSALIRRVMLMIYLSSSSERVFLDLIFSFLISVFAALATM